DWSSDVCSSDLSLWDGFLRSTIVLQTFRPSGTVPTFYDCATNIPSLWDGFLRSTIVLQTFRPYGTVPQALRLCYKRSVPLGRFPTFEDCATHLVPLGQVGCGSSFRAERKFWWLTSGVIRCPTSLEVRILLFTLRVIGGVQRPVGTPCL